MGQTIEISVNRINQGSRLAGSSGGTAKTYLLRQERVESSQVRVCAHALVIITRAKIMLAGPWVRTHVILNAILTFNQTND